MKHVDYQPENGRRILGTLSFEHWFLIGDTSLSSVLAHRHLLALFCGQILVPKVPILSQIMTKPQSQLLQFPHKRMPLDRPCA